MSFNMEKWFLVFACIWLMNGKGVSQIIFQDIPGKISHSEKMALFTKALLLSDSLEAKRKDHYKMYILYRGQELLLFCDGFFDVFVWKNRQWNEVSKKRRGGYNFSSKKFIWRNRIFSFGGYGYWQHHGELIEFDMAEGIWKKMAVAEKLPFAPAIITEEGLKVISDACYEVNLSSLEVKKYPLEMINKLDNNSVAKGLKMESAYWAFLLLGKENYLLDKKSQQLYYSDILTTEVVDKTFFYEYSLIQCKGDSLIRWLPNGKLAKAINIREMLKFYKPLNLQTGDINASLLFGVVTIFFALGGGLIYLLKRKKKYKHSTTTWHHPFIPVLINSAGPPMSTEQLDKLLDLEGIQSMEYRKYKRAQILSEVNEEFRYRLGRDLVSRMKDPEDGRRFIYEIKA